MVNSVRASLREHTPRSLELSRPLKPLYPSPDCKYHFEAQVVESTKFKLVDSASSEVMFDLSDSSWQVLHVAWITASMIGMRVQSITTEGRGLALVIDLDKDLVTYEDGTLSSVSEVRSALDEMNSNHP